ncbi:hypothetical protein L915_11499 [Phytophthora nicotianae]|uniref:Uncharacterized protein n=1 Tax=Phytophthora nicotianae TaxID=4792 RepID=W2IR29_PHYNI|nr:hypothetical protein L915_11499 [Phytophthora nicotianae]ETL36649.1 hypothetical protein L916_11413 [Phytophthora nicotianae]
MAELSPGDFIDSTADFSSAMSTAKLINDAETTINSVSTLRNSVASTCKIYRSVNSVLLPHDFTLDTFSSRIIKPNQDSDCCGTQRFIDTFRTASTRLERLKDCYGSVPYSSPPSEPRWTPDSLPSFPTIAMLSEAFKLNFWQHVIFEATARHLIYAYSEDIESTSSEASFPISTRPVVYDIKDQLIAYLGGQAGTGKSTVVQELLTLARKVGS